MTLGSLLDAIRRSDGPVTPTTLAERLGASTEDVTAMLSALRAAGIIGQSATRGPEACRGAAPCVSACPGPAGCPLVAAIRLETLAIHRV